MNITVKPFGQTQLGEAAYLYTLTNNKGMSVTISNFGGVITNLMVPDKKGAVADVVLGHNSMEEYLTNPGSFNALIGRNSNRIRGAAIEIDGTAYTLENNKGGVNLHTGAKGTQFQLFHAEASTDEDTATLHLSLLVQDLEDGFPGNLEIEVDYTLTDNNTLAIEYHAVSDQATIINMTNHAYFNLGGHASGTIHEHILQMNAPFFTPSDSESIPTGELLSVTGTPLDFTAPAPLGQALVKDSFAQIIPTKGVDHNFVLGGTGYREVAVLKDPASGRSMHISTDLPAIQVYAGNFLPNEGTPEKDGVEYPQHAGVCFETQTVPNAAQMPWLSSPIYQAGEEYFATTSFHFDAE